MALLKGSDIMAKFCRIFFVTQDPPRALANSIKLLCLKNEFLFLLFLYEHLRSKMSSEIKYLEELSKFLISPTEVKFGNGHRSLVKF